MLEIQFSLGQQYSVVFYYDEVNTNVNSIQSVILFILSLRNNQENDYIGTKTPHFITLKASADCGIQPTLDLDTALPYVPEWCLDQLRCGDTAVYTHHL